MISDAEQTGQRRRSAETTSTLSEGPEGDEFLNKVCKFELISRGKSTPISRSSSSKSAGKLNISSPDAKSGRRSGENFGQVQHYVGEKLFTKDTATTRVSASVISPTKVGPKPDNPSSQDINANSIGSFGSVSSRRKSGESRNSGSSFKSRSSAKSSESPVYSPRDSSSSNSSNIFFNSLVSPVRKTELAPSPFYGTGKSPSSPLSPNNQSSPRSPVGVSPWSPVGVTTPIQESPKFTVELAQDSIGKEKSKIETKLNGVANGKDYLMVDDSDSSGSRNTFDGIDFDFNELTESQKDLTLKHREVVAERKQEQEMERLEKLRLEEILNMCAEYEKQIEAEKASIVYKQQQSFTTDFKTADENTPPIPPLPAQYQHLSKSSNYNQSQSSPKMFSQNSPRSLESPKVLTSVSSNNQESSKSFLSTTSKDNEHAKFQTEQTRSSEPPKHLDFETQSLDRRDLHQKGEQRSSMTNKIMTNGSLTMLSSPTNPHKDFMHGFQIRKCGSNSSNSEDESLCGSSEDTGTIKRRPNSNQSPVGTDRPKSPRTSPRSPLTISKYSNQSVTSNWQTDQSHQPVIGSTLLSSTVTTSDTATFTSSPKPVKIDTDQYSAIQDDFTKQFKIEPLRLTKVSVGEHNLNTSDQTDLKHTSTYSEPECDLQLNQDRIRELELSEHTDQVTQVTSDTKQMLAADDDTLTTATNNHSDTNNGAKVSEGNFTINGGYAYSFKRSDTVHHDYVNLVQGSHMSDSNGTGSSSSTICPSVVSGITSQMTTSGSPRSSKSSSFENVTPVNSDNEFSLPVVTKESSRPSSESTGSTAESSECSWGTVDVSIFFCPLVL